MKKEAIDKIVEILNKDKKAKTLLNLFEAAVDGAEGVSQEEVEKTREAVIMIAMAHNKEAMKVMAEEVYNEIHNQEEPEMTNQKKSISIDNGLSFVEPEEAIKEKEWAVIAHYMEDEAREQVHNELAPCTNLEFLKRYLEVAEYDLVIG